MKKVLAGILAVMLTFSAAALPNALCPRQVLHAKTLGFTHPRTGERMFFDSQWPEDMTALIEKWRHYEPNTLN